jgi:hypothetical protein
MFTLRPAPIRDYRPSPFMAYVPKFDYDLFFSYAHDDSAQWIHALQGSLREALVDWLGSGFAIWEDKNRIRFGQNWSQEIQDGVKGSAAFLAVVSPNYERSDWCARERKLFLEHSKAEGKLKAGRYYRFLKLVRLPWPDNGHEKFHPELQPLTFFDPSGEEAIEFVPGTNEFQAKVREAGQAIKSLLLEMRRGQEAVFIARSAEDTFDASRRLQRELQAQGYNVRPEGPLDEGYSDELIEKQMQPAVLNVHVLGAAYDPFAERLIDLAVKLEKRLVFWLTPEAGLSQDDQQQKLIEQIRLEQKQRAQWDLLPDRSLQAVIQHILEMLRPKPAAAPANTNGHSPRVYLLCDSTTAEDTERAREIQAQIRDREHMRVDLPAIPGSGVKPTDLHEEMLRECDGLLLYRKAAPETWFYQTCNDVLFTEGKVKRERPVRSKAFLVNDPKLLQGIERVPVIPQAERFQISDLEPFLAPLRKRDAHAAD